MSKSTSHPATGEQKGRGNLSPGLPAAQVRGQLWGTPVPAQGRATCLHNAAGSRDVLRDADFIAALQEDGPVVVDIQDGHEHRGSAGAPVPGGTIVCRDRKERERVQPPTLSSAHGC